LSHLSPRFALQNSAIKDMIPYDFSQKAREQIEKMSEDDQLSAPDPLSFAKFIGRRSDIKVYRYRIGNWRVIFDWEDGKSIFITQIKPRKAKDIYKF